MEGALIKVGCQRYQMTSVWNQVRMMSFPGLFYLIDD